jgi:SHS2 domain-containing protein
VLAEFEVQLSKEGLSAVGRGELFDPARHVPAHEVKAITYHGLKCEPTAGGWLAEVIVDI